MATNNKGTFATWGRGVAEGTPLATSYATPSAGAAVTPTAPTAPAVQSPFAAALAANPARVDGFTRSDARQVIVGMFETFGFSPDAISGLTSKYWEGQQRGLTPDALAAMAPAWDEYQSRFSANKDRIKNGLAALDAKTYMALERGYAQVLSSYKMPAGFYDNPQTDFSSWIANDVSVDEINGRVKVAYDWGNSVDAETKQALKTFYGVQEADLAAYALDRERALPLLEKQYKTTQIGAEAIRQDLNFGKTFSEGLVEKDITQQQARSAFSATAESMPTAATLGTIENTTLTAEETANAALQLDAGATAKVKGLASRERARFGGASAGTQILSQNVSGSY